MSQESNPLLAEWDTPLGAPPFPQFRPEHFSPAFDKVLADHRVQVEAIAGSHEPPTFDNTIAALERAGLPLGRLCAVFFGLIGADTNDKLDALQTEFAPRLSRHHSDIFMNERLFSRIEQLWESRETSCADEEQAKVLERYRTDFIRSGVALDEADKQRMKEIKDRMSSLMTTFSQNVLADERDYIIELKDEADLDGLPQFLRDSTAAVAAERGLKSCGHAVSLARSVIEPFLTFSTRRDLREKAFQAWVNRGANGNATDNTGILLEIVALRREQAKLLGFETYTDYVLDDAMAKSAKDVEKLLHAVWKPAQARSLDERDALQDLVAREGGNFAVAPWDWRYYSEKIRSEKHDIDEAELKPYFQLDRIVDAAFETAGRLFDLKFRERDDIPKLHPDIRTWEVLSSDGEHVGLFLGDYFARPSKRSGAWMSSLRPQHRLDGDVRPIVNNVMNFSKGAPGEPALLSVSDAETVFHEFGHALHALLSDVTYPEISGTNVARDYVELPSQLFEHWLFEPDILRKYAVHYRTGEPIPDSLLDKLLAARNFNQGFETVEYLSSALVDLELHKAENVDNVDAFEAEVLGTLGMPDEIRMRHRLPHFLHLFASSGYASAYYSYMWSEVMDADAFEAFREAGDAFDSETAARLKSSIYSSGGRLDPNEAYLSFRGRPPRVESLLEKRGLA